jgi:arginine/lysine/ornithine decarboxylase
VLIDEITEYERIVNKLDDYSLTAKFYKLSEKIKKSLELDRLVSFRAMLNTRYELKKILNNNLEVYQHVTINAETGSVKTL